MDMNNGDRVARGQRAFTLCAAALVWELLARPFLGICFPDLDLPPSFLREALVLLDRLSELAI